MRWTDRDGGRHTHGGAPAEDYAEAAGNGYDTSELYELYGSVNR